MNVPKDNKTKFSKEVKDCKPTKEQTAKNRQSTKLWSHPPNMEPSPPEAKYQEKETDEDMEPVKDAEPPSPSSSHPEIQKCSPISTQSAVSTVEVQGTSGPVTAIPAHMTLKLLSEMSGSARDINAGAPLSLEEWQAFEKEL